MTIDSARKFLLNISSNHRLASELNNAASIAQLEQILTQAGYEFTSYELDEAYNNLLTKIQFEEDADIINMNRCWYDMLLSVLGGEEK